MSISINNNFQTQSYNPIVKKKNTEANSFTMLKMEEQTQLDVSDTHANRKVSDEDFNIFQNDLMLRARVLPEGIGMNTEQFLAYHKSKTAKIVFEFDENGSIHIKEGLSPADYARAKAALKDYEFWLNGGTFTR